MIGQRYKSPLTVCDSGTIQVVGREKHKPDKSFKIRGTGNIAYWCCEVVDGKPRGFAFAVGSDELETWERL